MTEQGQRADRMRNRERLLAAAREVFVESGPGVSIESIAKRAGVGATTFYRHFSTKEDLVDALLARLAEGSGLVRDEAARVPDDWEAFSMVFTQGCVLDPKDIRLFDALCRTSEQAASTGRAIVTALLEPVVERARRVHALRENVNVEGVAALMRAADSAANPTERKMVASVLLDGLRAP